MGSTHVGRYWRVLNCGERPEDHLYCQGLVLRQDASANYVFSWEYVPTYLQSMPIKEDGSLDRIYGLCRVPDYSEVPKHMRGTPLENPYWKLLEGWQECGM